MNPRLAESASPYLRAHAHNPVPWYPWGREAFDEARRRDVPVLVSIGYSTCHWCHVMARESFADDATAQLIDRDFVAVKVDREEHPDVDAAYMAAASAFTPHLGWPLTVFVTPEGRPFYAGTYFPPVPRSGIPSFTQVLGAVHEAWSERRTQVDGTADAVAEALAEMRESASVGGSLPSLDALAEAAARLAAREDPRHGGFGDGDGTAPKFPIATALRFLQAPAIREAAAAAASVVDRALAAMAGSELYDSVEGGFFRYATRPDWSIPHFERMLTDNAQLLEVAADAGDTETAAGVAGFLTGVLQQPGGGFGAAQDSESWIEGERSEGGYYARDAGARAALEPPAVDGKVVTGWNGLAISALARAGSRQGEESWIEAARWAAEAVLGSNTDRDGGLVRASLDEIPSRAPATLADHGQFAVGLIALAAATGEVAYAVRAREIVRACIGEDGMPRTPGGGDRVLAAQGIGAPDAASDGDEPSGASSLAEAALALWRLGDGDGFRELAEAIISRHAAVALAQPLAYGALLRVAAQLAVPPRQVVVVTEDRDSDLARAAAALPADVVVVTDDAQARAFAAAGFSLLAEKSTLSQQTTVFVCEAFACRMPVTRIEQLTA
jgi:hypothetical protein